MLKLDEFFKVRRNVIFERARFNRRVQKEGESADQFITALYELIETCEYGDLKGEMLRDRIVVGLRNTTLSERLQLDPDLTLEKAKRTARQKEAVKEHRQELQGDGTVQSLTRLWWKKCEVAAQQAHVAASLALQADRQNKAGRRDAKVETNVSVVGTTTQGQSNALLEMPFVFNAIVRDTSGLSASRRL